MNADQLVALGNQSREDNNPEQALSYYAQAFVSDRLNSHAWNNYGNVLREVGDPAGALPFLQRAAILDPSNSTTQFNIAVAHLLLGDYHKGWPQYETRWNFEHLAGTLPQYEQPRWTGQDLRDKTIFVIGEQGHGDNIQFLRFILNLKDLGANIILQLNDNVATLVGNASVVGQIVDIGQTPDHFDYWAPIMSLPGVLNIALENLNQAVQYVVPSSTLTKEWAKILGLKFKLRVGFCWSGRRDTWINRHKGMPFEKIVKLISDNPTYEWINLQADTTDSESQILESIGVSQYPGSIRSFADTAALIQNLDVVISVDTAIAHLSGAIGRPTWIMLSQYAVDWRWLLDRDSNPWYPTARLFRQPKMGDWDSVTAKIHQYLSWFKV